jgi:hypothetical protein
MLGPTELRRGGLKMANEVQRKKARSGGSNAPVVPQLRADPKKKPARPAPPTEIAPRDEGGIFKDIFDVIIRAKNRKGLIDQAIDEALKGNQPDTSNR